MHSSEHPALCPKTHRKKAAKIQELEDDIRKLARLAVHLAALDNHTEKDLKQGGETEYDVLSAFRAREWLLARIEQSFLPLRHPDTIRFAVEEAARTGQTFMPPTTIAPEPELELKSDPAPSASYEELRTAAHERILELYEQGTSLRKIVATLESESIRGPHGGSWHVTSVRRVILSSEKG